MAPNQPMRGAGYPALHLPASGVHACRPQLWNCTALFPGGHDRCAPALGSASFFYAQNSLLLVAAHLCMREATQAPRIMRDVDQMSADLARWGQEEETRS